MDAAWEAWISEPGRATTNFGWYALGYAAGQASIAVLAEALLKELKVVEIDMRSSVEAIGAYLGASDALETAVREWRAERGA